MREEAPATASALIAASKLFLPAMRREFDDPSYCDTNVYWPRARRNEEKTMLDHIGIEVRDYERSKSFYTAALAPLGYTLIVEVQGWAGFGAAGKPDFWIRGGQHMLPPIHVAFRSEDRAVVRAFHAAGLEAGGKDNGAPGLRTMYHPHYYGAFVLDPDGHNIEAVCHTPHY